MAEIQKIKVLCEKYGIRPSKKYGQNFLVNANVARMMVEHANLDAHDVVVEVGPGLGALTQELAKRAKKVLAVEIDKQMFAAARDILAPHKNVEVVHGDILKISNGQLIEMLYNPTQPPLTLRGGERRSYKVVASLPYSITSAALRKFTEEEPRPSVCVFLVQKEVAQRVCAKPGEMSVLSAAVQFYGKPEIVATVPRSAFWPQPEVESAIVRIKIYGGPTSVRSEVGPHDIDFQKRFFQIVRIGFSARRKQLQNNLMNGLRMSRDAVFSVLKNVGLDERIRAQDLSVEQWIRLVDEIGKEKPKSE